MKNPRLLNGELKLTDGGLETVGDSDITLRDIFAGMAMQGMIAREDSGDTTYSTIAKCAFKYADAMLDEREERALAEVEKP